MKKTFFGIILGAIVVFAASNASGQSAAPAGSQTRTFIITAYYSPVLGQDRYITGSYADEIRLNGEGTHGADGTPVGHGMVAAPRTYDFGTQIYIPGYGMGEVHDRGGAIVSANNKLAYDRLDIWVGHGDAGLNAALQWGLKTVDCVVYGEAETPIVKPAEYVDSERRFTQNLAEGDRGTEVRALQYILRERGFLGAIPSSYYGEKTRRALVAYQLYHGIIKATTDDGAGMFGPSTRQFIESHWRERTHRVESGKSPYWFEFNTSLQLGDTNDAVRHLQSLLVAWGYMTEYPSGYFGQLTKEAVTQWQLDQGVITNTNIGGRFGPQSIAHFDAIMLRTADASPPEPPAENTQKEAEYTPQQMPERQSIVLQFASPDLLGAGLEVGDEGDRVMLLQQILQAEGFLGVEPTGYFGSQTEAAIIRYQLARSVVSSPRSPGAGRFGPATQREMFATWGAQ